MSTMINDTSITSKITHHRAERLADGMWGVTFLPGRTVTKNQAITAMTIAEVIRTHWEELQNPLDKWHGHIDGWAAELGMTGPEVISAAVKTAESYTPAPIKFLVTMKPHGRRTKIDVSAHDPAAPMFSAAPFYVTGAMLPVDGTRNRADAVAYLAEVIAAWNLALNPPHTVADAGAIDPGFAAAFVEHADMEPLPFGDRL